VDAAAATADPPGRKPGSFVIVETSTDAFVGVIGFKRRDAACPAHVSAQPQQSPDLELWYQLTPLQWGRGFGTEAATLALQWAATVPLDDVVVASTQAANERSLRMLRGLGFREHTRFVEYDANQVLLVRALDQQG
jgi:RimJ/RimL family protein N-acetyltransferase